MNGRCAIFVIARVPSSLVEISRLWCCYDGPCASGLQGRAVQRPARCPSSSSLGLRIKMVWLVFDATKGGWGSPAFPLFPFLCLLLLLLLRAVDRNLWALKLRGHPYRPLSECAYFHRLPRPQCEVDGRVTTVMRSTGGREWATQR